ncbi:MAG: SDR family NAD(P)-dependent oxidoreductase [Alphaproteobacteria bacterium]
MHKAPKMLITGATSGIGWALAVAAVQAGYVVGVTGRRKERLQALQHQLGKQRCHIAAFDITAPDATKHLNNLAKRMGGLDIFVANAGTGYVESALNHAQERATLEVNVLAFYESVHWAATTFVHQGHGHLVGITSFATTHANSYTPMYNATKAFNARYLAGLRRWLQRYGHAVAVTDIRPGFVASEMTDGIPGKFWEAPADVAARAILAAIQRRARVAYITRRWGWLAQVVKVLDFFGYAP